MGMGGAVVLFAIGAILKFATSAQVSGFDLQTIGVIIMVVSAIWFAIMMAVYLSRRRTSVVRDQVTTVDPGYREGVYRSDPTYRGQTRRTYEERSDYNEPL
jgi:hypothetical protein